MASIVIHTKTAHINMGPLGFIIYANDFLEAYKSFETEKKFSPAKYYLVCRSAELALKSYLCFKEIPVKKLKKDFGYDLHKILRKSKELGIDAVVSISEEEKLEVEKANSWYNRKSFEYFDIQNVVESRDSLPKLVVIFNLAERLIKVLESLCLSSAQKP